MIVFDLRCGGAGHVFEAWFASSAAYEEQQARGLVSCPVCGSVDVTKAPMAPAVPAKARSKAGQGDLPSLDSEQVKEMLSTMAELQRKILEKSENVGGRFTDEARAIHLGEVEARAIHGRATPDQASSLIEDGIPVAALPFPILEPEAKN